MNGKIVCLATCATLLSARAHSEDLQVGDLHPITGPAAYYGLPESQAVKLASEQINAAGGIDAGGTHYMLRVVTGDTQASPTASVGALKKMLTEDVRFLIGPLASGVAPALKPIVFADSKLTQIIDGTIADSVVNGRNVFRNQATVENYNIALASVVEAKRYPTAVIMTDRFHAGFMESQASLVKTLETNGTKIVGEEYFKLNDSDFSSQLTKARSLNPAAIILRGYPAEGALITRQAHQLGYTGQIIWEFVAPPETVTKNISAAEMEGVINAIPPTTQDYIAARSKNALAFADAYKKRWGMPPGELSALSYDATYILAAAIKRAGSTDNDAVNHSLAELTVAELPGLIDTYKPYDGGLLFKDGQAFLPGIAQVWKGGSWQPAGQL